MNKKQIKILREAFPIFVKKTKVSSLGGSNAVVVTIPFQCCNGNDLYFYVYIPNKSRKMILISKPLAVEQAKEQALIQKLVKEYGVSVSDTRELFEDSNRPLGERIAAMVQAQISLDAAVRSSRILFKEKNGEYRDAADGASDQGGASRAC